jgi:hypothetical protein
MPSLRESHPIMYAALAELKDMRAGRNYEQLPADVDVVWVLSGHGTADSKQETGVFQGRSMDRERIDAGVKIVTQVTANRVGKTPEDVTQDDIAESGPLFFYNGEPHQNVAMKLLAGADDFPIPNNKVQIESIPTNNTPGQVVSFGENITGKERTVVVVTHAQHVPRSDRYLAHHADAIPGNPQFVFHPVPETKVAAGAVLGEITRIEAYAKKGDLAERPHSRRYVNL